MLVMDLLLSRPSSAGEGSLRLLGDMLAPAVPCPGAKSVEALTMLLLPDPICMMPDSDIYYTDERCMISTLSSNTDLMALLLPRLAVRWCVLDACITQWQT